MIASSKPAGVNTHRVENNARSTGFVEILGEHLGRELKVCQRLDKDTSGIILFAEDKSEAAALTELFTERQVEKHYYFITQKPRQHYPAGETLTHRSSIEKQGKRYFSCSKGAMNAETTFTKIKQEDGNELWLAAPHTGKTHQIRLHAADLGINILGDTLYAGGTAPRLMLHATSLRLRLGERLMHFTSPLPSYFAGLQILSNPPLLNLLVCSELQDGVYSLQRSQTDCYRLIDRNVTDLKLDNYNQRYWFYSYSGQLLDSQGVSAIDKFCKIQGVTQYKVQQMKNRGKSEVLKQQAVSTINADQWVVRENGLKFLIKKNQGASPGLFLDQRINRRWVLNNSRNKKVLNLFAYTAGLSVAACAGGADQLVTVDTSKSSLTWAKENFKLNGFDPEQHKFYAQDAREFIRVAAKTKNFFDLIICDPPSFARSKKSVFSLEKDISALLNTLSKILTPGGLLLFCTNYEKWDQAKVESLVKTNSALKIQRQATGLENLAIWQNKNLSSMLKSVLARA